MLRRLRRKPQLRITVETAETFGIVAAKLRKAGKDPHVRVNDLWLAAQAHYDELLARGVERWDARDRVREDIDRVLSRWREG